MCFDDSIREYQLIQGTFTELYVLIVISHSMFFHAGNTTVEKTTRKEDHSQSEAVRVPDSKCLFLHISQTERSAETV